MGGGQEQRVLGLGFAGVFLSFFFFPSKFVFWKVERHFFVCGGGGVWERDCNREDLEEECWAGLGGARGSWAWGWA